VSQPAQEAALTAARGVTRDERRCAHLLGERRARICGRGPELVVRDRDVAAVASCDR